MALVEEHSSPAAPEAADTANLSLQEILEKQREAFLRDGPPPLAHRLSAIDKVHRILMDHKDEWVEAISADFGNRAKEETLVAEIFLPVNSVRHCRKHVKKWMKPKKVSIAAQFKPAKGKVHYQPLGVVGVIAPWNYPLQLAIVPLVQALSAGNRVMIKPSELTPHTSDLLKKTIEENFSIEEVAVVTGGPEVGAEFSGLPFDHLFYTGSTNVGRLVMQAAAKNLTPVTLELGGKSPCIVGEECDLKSAMPSLAGGKLLNAGQTCVAPDYSFVPEAKLDEFVEAFEKTASKLYPTLADNDQYTSIVSDRHYERIQALLEDAQAKGAKVLQYLPAGENLSGSRKIAPTLVLNVTEDMDVMQEEIFGPVMPVKTYKSEEDAIRYVNEHPRPLALYYYGPNADKRDAVLNQTISGGACVNDTLFHLAQEELPFGGVGPSGMGSYHGFAGFRTFSHEKSVMYQAKFNGGWMFRAPYKWPFKPVLNLLMGK